MNKTLERPLGTLSLSGHHFSGMESAIIFAFLAFLSPMYLHLQDYSHVIGPSSRSESSQLNPMLVLMCMKLLRDY